MKITKFGHACLFIEEGKARILIDPGVFSKGFEDRQADALLITHQHSDHMQVGTVKALLAKNPKLAVYADADTAKMLAETGVAAKVAREGDTFEVVGVKVAVYGQRHAAVYGDVPGITNVGYMVAERFFYPGDAFTNPGVPVEVLATPAGAPWMKVAEAVDYLRTVKPKLAFPVHDAVLSEAGRGFHFGLLEQLGGAPWRVVADGQSLEA